MTKNHNQHTVYLAGPLSDGENPHAWHEAVQAAEPDLEWINPFAIHGENPTGEEIYRGDVDAVVSSDALLLRRIDNYEVCGAYIEAGIAGAHGVPTVVWNDAESDVPEFLLWHADAVCQSMEQAIAEVVA